MNNIPRVSLEKRFLDTLSDSSVKKIKLRLKRKAPDRMTDLVSKLCNAYELVADNSADTLVIAKRFCCWRSTAVSWVVLSLIGFYACQGVNLNYVFVESEEVLEKGKLFVNAIKSIT